MLFNVIRRRRGLTREEIAHAVSRVYAGAKTTVAHDWTISVDTVPARKIAVTNDWIAMNVEVAGLSPRQLEARIRRVQGTTVWVKDTAGVFCYLLD